MDEAGGTEVGGGLQYLAFRQERPTVSDGEPRTGLLVLCGPVVVGSDSAVGGPVL